MREIIAILKRVTAIVKIAPFITAFFLLISYIFYLVSDWLATIVDVIFYVSPIMVAFMLLLSKALKLCFWHRLQCVLPLLPMLVNITDYFIELTQFSSILNILIQVIVCALSLINAYFVFTNRQ
jgi:hypothetical protein